MRPPATSVAALLLCLSATAFAADADDATAFFETKIRPILVERCYECHGEKKQKGGLRLDSRAAWQKGGDDGPVIIPGDLERSPLIKAIRGSDKDLQMPPKKPLPAAEIAALEEWVKQGAPDPRTEAPIVAKGPSAGREHWAFQPVTDPAIPESPEDTWSRTPVDRFIWARLHEAGLQPSAPADPRTLIRRATYDLTGLPPTPQEVAAFERNPSPDAFAKVVDRLLASPHYGEHWARHWLDVARYSDTKGYVYAREEKQWVHASAYRDWVARALNDDLPYDQFLLRQIAADQIDPPGSPHLAAMGFLTLGRRFLGVMHDIIDDRIDVTMRTTQALTVGCARCHDHKFDPIPTRDYYALYGVFRSCAEAVVPCGPDSQSETVARELAKRQVNLDKTMAKRREEQMARVRTKLPEHLLAQLELDQYPEESFSQIIAANDLNPLFVRRWQAYLAAAAERNDPVFAPWLALMKLQPLDGAIMENVARGYGALFAEVEKHGDDTPGSLWRVLHGPDSPCFVPDEHIANIEFLLPTDVTVELWKLQGDVDRSLLQADDGWPHATILVDRPEPFAPRVFKRGNPLTKGDAVPRQFLQVLAKGTPTPFQHGSGRLELAQAITSRENPLTARVMVNRVWMHHFGRGLVSTTSDFGTRAEPPSHPELLDWLARRFMDEGWSLKALHRRLMLSATYQQGTGRVNERDTENRLVGRMTPHRLTFEETRDTWLTATGELDERVGGKPLDLFAKDNRRRTLYARVDRESLASAFRTFDFANPDLSVSQRTETIVPQQALFALNHPFTAEKARALARRTEKAASDVDRVRQMYALLFQRAPASAELSAALAFTAPEDAPALTRRTHPEAWQYGYGEFDEKTGQLKNFTTLPHLEAKAWQGGPRWPDAKLGWLQLTAEGGHPGNDRQHAVARRWVAPYDGTYTIHSKIIHEPAVGDGIRAFISHSSVGLLASATVHHGDSALDVETLSMSAGDTIDFVVDIRDGLNSDQFLWAPKITASTGTGAGEADGLEWDAREDFPGKTTQPLTPWEQLAQTLMLTNEFLFVD